MTDKRFLGGLRSAVSVRLPRSFVPIGQRVMRRLDQLIGYPASRHRPGVIIMLHIGRCGSTVIANLLEQNPEIYWDAKLHRKAQALYGDRFSHMNYVSWTQQQFSMSGARYYGFEFKILEDQYPALLNTTRATFFDHCKSIGITHYILLHRRNTLRHVVSHYTSMARGNWHNDSTQQASRVQIDLDLQRVSTGRGPGRPLLRYLEEVAEAHDQTRNAFQDKAFLELEYETDIDSAGVEHGYHKVCEFLAVQPLPVALKNSRTNPFPLSETVRNYDELSSYLTGTEFEWMLE